MAAWASPASPCVTNRSRPSPYSSRTPTAAYRAPVSSVAVSRRRCSTASTSRSCATAVMRSTQAEDFDGAGAVRADVDVDRQPQTAAGLLVEHLQVSRELASRDL